jgi:hypothetical protein
MVDNINMDLKKLNMRCRLGFLSQDKVHLWVHECGNEALGSIKWEFPDQLNDYQFPKNSASSDSVWHYVEQ